MVNRSVLYGMSESGWIYFNWLETLFIPKVHTIPIDQLFPLLIGLNLIIWYWFSYKPGSNILAFPLTCHTHRSIFLKITLCHIFITKLPDSVAKFQFFVQIDSIEQWLGISWVYLQQRFPTYNIDEIFYIISAT